MTDQRSFCREHPDQSSAGTCARCGRFACASCFHPDTGRCTTCASQAADALSIGATPFSVGHVLASGFRLVRTAFPTAVGVSALMLLSSFALGSFPLPGPVLDAVRAAGLPAAFGPWLVVVVKSLAVGTYLRGVLLAQMAGAAQGEAVSVPAALWRSARAFPRLLWAQFVATVLTLLGAVACGLPGLYAAVVLSLVLPVAYLDPDSPVAETSADLTRGRRWQMLALVLLSRGVIVGTVAVSPPLVTSLAGTGVSPASAGNALVMGLAMELVRELVESFTIALMLAAYLSLRGDAERAVRVELPVMAPSVASAPPPAPGPLFRAT